jgi:hypothetical protein
MHRRQTGSLLGNSTACAVAVIPSALRSSSMDGTKCWPNGVMHIIVDWMDHRLHARHRVHSHCDIFPIGIHVIPSCCCKALLPHLLPSSKTGSGQVGTVGMSPGGEFQSPRQQRRSEKQHRVLHCLPHKAACCSTFVSSTVCSTAYSSDLQVSIVAQEPSPRSSGHSPRSCTSWYGLLLCAVLCCLCCMTWQQSQQEIMVT